MAMGSGAWLERLHLPIEVSSGHGVDSLKGAQHRPGAGKRARRRAQQRTTLRFHRAVELAGNDERGRRARRVRFLEKLCLQLDDSRKAAGKDLARLQEEVRSVTTRRAERAEHRCFKQEKANADFF